MIGPKAPQVIPKFSGATSADSQMMNGRRRLVIDPETGTPESMREFRLEIISYTHEPFVKPPEPQHYIATYRKIPAHKVLDPSRPDGGEVKTNIARKISTHLPWLDDAPSHERRASRLQCVDVGLNQPSIWDDVVIKKQHERVARLKQSAVHRSRNTRMF